MVRITGLGGGDNRGQSFTLEGFFGAIIILTALLFAMEAIVLTPTTAGTVDQDVKAQLEVEARDILVTAGQNGSLERMALYWNVSQTKTGWFAYTKNPTIGYGSDPPCTRGPNDKKRVCDSLGETLNNTVSAQGFTYNLYLTYLNESATGEPTTETIRIAYQGVPSDNAVSSSYTVLLYDNMTLTAPSNGEGKTIGQLGNEGRFYAPDIDDGVLYNVVEVRVVVW